MDGSGTVNGIIDFGGGTAAAAGTTMNANDTITGTSAISGDLLKVSLQNAGAAIGSSSNGTAQKITFTVQNPVLDQAQVNQYTMNTVGTSAGNAKATDVVTFTYGGSVGSYVIAASAGDTATAAAAAINGVAGQTVAFVGLANTSAITTAGAITLTSTTAVKPGMSVFDGSTFVGYVKSVTSATAATLDRSISSAITSTSLTYGGGATAVSVIAPTAGTAIPPIVFTSTTGATGGNNPVTTFTIPNVDGTVGDIVTVTYNGVSATYTVQGGADVAAAKAATLTALEAALDTVMLGTATAAVSSGTVVATANTAGVTLPAVTFSGAGASLPSGSITTTPVSPSAGVISFGNNSGLDALYVNNISGHAATIDQNSVSGATQLWADRSTGAVTFTNVGQNTTIGINANSTTLLGAVTSTTVAGTTAASLVINGGVNAGGVTLNADADGLLKTVNVSSTGGAQTAAAGQVNTVTSLAATNTATRVNINAATSLALGTGVTGNAVATLAVTGAATLVNLGTSAVAASVRTIDASAMTAGGVSVVLASGVTSFIGGAGNDTVETNGARAATAVITAGTGTDTLVLTNATDVNTAAKATQYVGFETYQVNYDGIQDMSLFSGATGLVLNNAGAEAANLNAATAANIRVLQTATDPSLSLANATGTADLMTITVRPSSSTSTTAINVTGLKVSGVENINFVNSSNAASTLSFAGSASAGVNTGVQNITLSGGRPVTVDLITADATSNQLLTLLSVNASALTAATTGTTTFTLSQTSTTGYAIANGLTVTGSSGDDSINLNTNTLASGVVASFNGGAGNDLFTVAADQLYKAGSGYIAINGGTQASSVGDMVRVLNATAWTVSDAAFGNMTGIEKLDYGTDGNLNLVSGTFFNSAFAANGVTVSASAQTAAATNTVNLTAFTGNATVILGSSTVALTGAATITGGSGNDTVTIKSGLTANNTAGSLVISTGAGNDVINITNAATALSTTAGQVAINGGAGADVINLTITNNTFNGGYAITTKSGDSIFAAYDMINGFAVTNKLIFTSDPSVTTAVAAVVTAGSGIAGYTAQQLTFGISNKGILTFAGTLAGTVTIDTVFSIFNSTIDPLQANGATFAWADNNNNTWVFNDNVVDTVIQLVGVTGVTDVSTSAGANTIFIG